MPDLTDAMTPEIDRGSGQSLKWCGEHGAVGIGLDDGVALAFSKLAALTQLLLN